MNIFKKLQNYLRYVKIVKKNWADMQSKFVLTKDWTYVFGTVINMPKEIVTYELEYPKKLIKDYIKKVGEYCDSIGLMELVHCYSVTKIDSYNYKVEFAYKHFDSKKLFKRLLLAASVLIAITLLFL
jgi:hypothetical protein